MEDGRDRGTVHLAYRTVHLAYRTVHLAIGQYI